MTDQQADRQTPVSVLLKHDVGELILRRHLPQLFAASIPPSVLEMPVGTLLDYARLEDPVVEDFLREIAVVTFPRRREAPAITPDPDYESAQVARASARLTTAADGELFATHELVIAGPSHGNPFVDVDLWADFRLDDTTLRVGGFYDGDGRHVIRFLPPKAGTWRYTTGSTARSLDGIEGELRIGASDRPSPVRPAGHHFTHADGSPFRPVGTTLYAWTHQEPWRETETLDTLARSAFTKVRMCVFPKHYSFNHEEPPRYPFERDGDGGWDTTRFDVDFFRHLESRVRDLADLGIHADIILFHPYDRWGFADLGQAADERYVRYVVRRLAGYANVWWSLANEYDLMTTKRDDDWERIGRLVEAEDHAGHLLSIHNGTRIFDFGADWITHASIQKTDADSPVPRIDAWRSKWGKPVVIDEPGYEGDIDFEWGSLSAEELVHRFWQSTVRGAYVTHGETYRAPDNKLWWATGGSLKGASPERIAFLARVVEECPAGHLEPLRGHSQLSHIRAAGVPGRYEVHYLDVYQPREFTFDWPAGQPVRVDIIDPWAMTIQPVAQTYEGGATVRLPGRPHLAVRLRSAD